MAQFIVYYSQDVAGPGPITGAAGDLLRVLDACLVNGYTGKAAAGWTKPIANSGNIGCYKQGAGCGYTMHVQDNGPNATSTFKEAWLTGWRTLTALSSTVGTGAGQFPLPAQLLTTGHVVARKSTTADGTARAWWVFADASTFYMMIATGDTAGAYGGGFMFGDIFSFKGSTDLGRCLLIGQAQENASPSNAQTVSSFDYHVNYSLNITNHPGHFNASPIESTGFSARVFKTAAYSLAPNANNQFLGGISGPNPVDFQFYLSPVLVSSLFTESVTDQTGAPVRGRMRGMWYCGHLAATFIDGQELTGTGNLAGKTFKIIKFGPSNAGYVLMEISNTLETN